MDRWAVGSQIAVAAVAAGAAVVALYVGAKDRRNARDIAEEDRRRAAEIARDAWDRQALVKLVQLAGLKAMENPNDSYILEIRGLLDGLGRDRVRQFRAYLAEYRGERKAIPPDVVRTLREDILRELRAELDALRAPEQHG